MRACFDTGSANAWILSSQCTNDRCTPGSFNEYYDPNESTTFTNTSEWTSIQFGSGALRGYFGIDDFRLGQGVNEIHIKEQTLGLIVEEHVLDNDYDAIIGLAYPQMANGGLPIVDSMMQQKLLKDNIFSFYMATNPMDQSELLFGSYDTSKFIGNIEWHPVVDKLFWSLRLDDIKYNGTPLNLCEGRKNGCMMTPDSGTSLITAPSWAYDKIMHALPQEDDCSDKFKFGTLTFVVDGIDYDIPSHHFMDVFHGVYKSNDSVCMTSITNLDIFQEGQENLFILGDAFMQIFYTIFDRDNDRVGLAKSRIYNSETTMNS